MLPQENARPDNTQFFDTIKEWAVLWNVPGLPGFARVSYDSNLRKSAGRSKPATGEIRLNPAFLSVHPEEFTETLCHEAAHLATYLLYGRNVRPHGQEWADLMTRAGFQPNRVCRTSFAVPSPAKGPRTLYLHRCPECHYVKRDRSARVRWACPQCLERGRNVPLEIAAVYRGGIRQDE